MLAAIVSWAAMGGAPALAEEPPPADLLLAPTGTELVTSEEGLSGAVHGDFLDGYPNLDVTVLDGASGAIRVGRHLAVLITVVRLATEADAAEALAAMGSPMSPEEMTADPAAAAALEAMGAEDPYVEVLSSPGIGAVARRVVVSERYDLVEFARATGRDLVVLAQLGVDGSEEVLPIMHETLDAHRAAFPDVTMPTGARSGPSWMLVGGVAAAALGVFGLFVALARGRRTTAPIWRSTVSVPPAPDDGPSRARVNW